MRSLLFIVPFALLSSTNVNAQVRESPKSDVQPTYTIEVTANEQPFQFYEYEAEWISGRYQLSNGWKIKVDPTSSGIVAQIDKRPPIRLVAVSGNRYVSPDGNMTMEFNRGLRRDEMKMDYMPDQRTAEVIVATATMAQR
jgi:hypothetical protein